MRILLYPHDLAIGGSQLNAIELAAGVRDLGHDVIIYGKRGPLVDTVERLGLEFVESPRPRLRPTPSIVADLRRLSAERDIDILHGFEWPPALECRMAVRGSSRTTAVATVMSMAVADFIPTTMPLTVGTEQLATQQARRGRRSVHLLEPPVDVAANAPDDGLRTQFREEHSIPPEMVLIVIVSRLARELKLEGILSSIEYVAGLDPALPVRLAIIGDGPARPEVQEAAFEANSRRPGSVVMTGGMADPRPAYAAADIALGMGGSALRALAFAKPLVVQGEGGYWQTLTPQSLDDFLWHGWYGVSEETGSSVARLGSMLDPLMQDATVRRALGEFGRESVAPRFSLETGARKLEAFYRESIQGSGQLQSETADDAVASLRYGKYVVSRMGQRIRRTAATDDFNRSPVAAARPPDGAPGRRRTVVHVAGTFWDDVQGTDHRLAQSISKSCDVIWVDPPRTLASVFRTRRLPTPAAWKVGEVAEGITRVQTQVPGGVSFPALNVLYGHFSAAIVRWLLRKNPESQPMVLHTSATAAFPRAVGGKKCYFVTDDWVSGAPLMGLPVGAVEKRMRENLGEADLVLAVSPVLVELVDRLGGSAVTRLLPNGCIMHEAVPSRRLSTVALLGQLNERLDLSLLEMIQASGLPLDIAGPLRGTEPRWRTRMEALLSSPGVTWRGEIPAHEVPAFLAGTSVGLTPYDLSAFNASSFPLKTLDYLAAGIPVVSTDLPSSRWLASDFVRIGRSAEEIVHLLRDVVATPFSDEAAALRRAEAARHSWDERAAQLLAWLEEPKRGASETTRLAK